MNMSKPGVSDAIPSKVTFTLINRIAFRANTKSYPVPCMKSNGLDWRKLFIHIEHRAGAVDREGLVHQTQIFTSGVSRRVQSFQALLRYGNPAENRVVMCEPLWTDALFGMIFMAAHEKSGMVWTWPKSRKKLFLQIIIYYYYYYYS